MDLTTVDNRLASVLPPVHHPRPGDGSEAARLGSYDLPSPATHTRAQS